MVGVLLAIITVALHVLHFQLLSIQTNSMVPLFRAGDVVLIDTKQRTLGVGTIAAFRSTVLPNVTVTHRIVAINAANQLVTTKGDNEFQADTPIRSQQIQGRVTMVVQKLGVFLSVFHQPLGLVFGLGVPVSIIITAELLRIINKPTYHHYRVVRYN
jgi:signal peptidase I